MNTENKWNIKLRMNKNIENADSPIIRGLRSHEEIV